MQWGQIKSLLILSFFVLDIYLFAQFLEKKEQADIGVLEHQSSTVEEQLEAESITFNDLPEEEYEETFISVEQQHFKEDELKRDKPKKRQDSYIFNSNMIASNMKKPQEVTVDKPEKLIDEIQDIVYYPEEYEFWNWNKEHNVLIFFQNKMDRPIYYNQHGIIIAFLNEKNEVTSYVQTMLGETESLAEKRKLIEPLTAIEKIYEEGKLQTGDDITKVNIGFHTRVPIESGVQVFAPTWKVNVNEDKEYFVNAIEGFIFSTHEEEFLDELMESIVDKSNVTKKSDDALKDIEKDIKKRIQQ